MSDFFQHRLAALVRSWRRQASKCTRNLRERGISRWGHGFEAGSRDALRFCARRLQEVLKTEH